LSTVPGRIVRDLSPLKRPSGAFAMLAVDQREAMRAMFAAYQDQPVSDQQLVEFKLAATRVLSPHASGVLVDKQFALDQVIEENAVVPTCGLIASADRFIAGRGEFVSDVELDDAVDAEYYRKLGVVAMKLLVIYRRDGDPAKRAALVESFLGRCHKANMISIIEPVAKAPRDGYKWNWDDDVIAAARELGSLGADLYKAEVPLRGQGDPDIIRRRCADITRAVSSPWLVLSSGVPDSVFPMAVELACREGASGFLAGRAVWSSVIGSDDIDRDLNEVAVPRLQRLCAVVDNYVRP